MPGFEPGIHEFAAAAKKSWVAGPSLAMKDGGIGAAEPHL
jgi:hypothetical protein